jgi:hypothetical protein
MSTRDVYSRPSIISGAMKRGLKRFRRLLNKFFFSLKKKMVQSIALIPSLKYFFGFLKKKFKIQNKGQGQRERF